MYEGGVERPDRHVFAADHLIARIEKQGYKMFLAPILDVREMPHHIGRAGDRRRDPHALIEAAFCQFKSRNQSRRFCPTNAFDGRQGFQIHVHQRVDRIMPAYLAGDFQHIAALVPGSQQNSQQFFIAQCLRPQPLEFFPGHIHIGHAHNPPSVLDKAIHFDLLNLGVPMVMGCLIFQALGRRFTRLF